MLQKADVWGVPLLHLLSLRGWQLCLQEDESLRMGLPVQAYLDLGRSSLPSISVRLIWALYVYFGHHVYFEKSLTLVATRSMQGALPNTSEL